jgi:Flp pilus assembly protein TadG
MFFIERFRKLRARMRADARKGSAAIEFAFVAPVFFVLLMGTFEAAIMFFSQSVLQNGMNDMGRFIRTGQVICYNKNAQAQCTSDMDQAQFRAMLCEKISPVIPCDDDNLQIDVVKFTDYGSVNRGQLPTQGSGLINMTPKDPNFNHYDPGEACDVVLARAFYTWPVSTPGLSYFLVDTVGDKHLVIAATAFRNEPYNSAAGGC